MSTCFLLFLLLVKFILNISYSLVLMRSTDDNGCLNQTPAHENPVNGVASFEFKRANGKSCTSQSRTTLGKPTPSKWDDAQKWLVNLSRGGEKNQSKTEPRYSNADDRRLIAPVPIKEDYSSSDDELKVCPGASSTSFEVETKKVDNDESGWRLNKPENAIPVVRSICLRDMGTDMTPSASQEPSRAATPLRVMNPAPQILRASRLLIPARGQNGVQAVDEGQVGIKSLDTGEVAGQISFMPNNKADQAKKLNPLETRAMAWDEAERARCLARFVLKTLCIFKLLKPII